MARQGPQQADALKALAERVNEALVKAGARAADDKMWRARLAVETEIPEQTLYTYRQARREPGVLAFARLAKALGVSVDWLLGLTDDPTPSAEITKALAECKSKRLAKKTND